MKTGYIYGALEESELRSGLTIAWGISSAIESSRKKAEERLSTSYLRASNHFGLAFTIAFTTDLTRRCNLFSLEL
jgi:hypothetical protein